MRTQRHEYMVLGRLVFDCEARINGFTPQSHPLWGVTIESHIAEMRRLWDLLDVKPEWLSIDQIENYETLLLQ